MIRATNPPKSWSKHFAMIVAKRKLNRRYGRWAARINRDYGKYGLVVGDGSTEA